MYGKGYPEDMAMAYAAVKEHKWNKNYHEQKDREKKKNKDRKDDKEVKKPLASFLITSRLKCKRLILRQSLFLIFKYKSWQALTKINTEKGNIFPITYPHLISILI